MNESETLLSLFVPQFACGMEIYMKNEDIKVFIVGTGSIGSSLAAQLSKDGFEVTVIDKDEEIKAYVVKVNEGLVPFTLRLGELTDEEREIILKGCLINYNRV